MLTIKDIHDAYPDSDLLPVEVTEETTLAEIEAVDLGDTLFLFLCRELCTPRDEINLHVALDRVERAKEDLEQVRAAIEDRLL